MPLLTAIRHRRLAASKSLSSARGAIDLASIMVGVLVIGIVGGVASATLFGVIPWAQDNAAKASVTAVGTAQAAGRMVENRYFDLARLQSEKLLPASSNIAVGTDANGTCFIAAARSDTGKIFFTHDRSPDATEYVAGVSTVAHCAGLDDIVSSITAPSTATTATRLVAAQDAYLATNGRYAGSTAELGFSANAGDAVVTVVHNPATLTNSVVDGRFELDPGTRIRNGGLNQLIPTRMETGGPSNGRYLHLKMSTGVKGLNYEAKLDGAGANIIPVTPGKDLTVSMDLRSTLEEPSILRAYFYNAAGAQVGTAVNAGSARSTGPDRFVKLGGTISASAVPATAVRMAIGFPIYAQGGPGQGDFVDIANASVVAGSYSTTTGSSTEFHLKEWFQAKTIGYIAVIRSVDGTVTAVTPDAPTGIDLGASTLAPASSNFLAGAGFPTSIPAWAQAAGWANQTSWDALRASSWAPQP